MRRNDRAPTHASHAVWGQSEAHFQGSPLLGLLLHSFHHCFDFWLQVSHHLHHHGHQALHHLWHFLKKGFSGWRLVERQNAVDLLFRVSVGVDFRERRLGFAEAHGDQRHHLLLHFASFRTLLGRHILVHLRQHALHHRFHHLHHLVALRQLQQFFGLCGLAGFVRTQGGCAPQKRDAGNESNGHVFHDVIIRYASSALTARNGPLHALLSSVCNRRSLMTIVNGR